MKNLLLIDRDLDQVEINIENEKVLNETIEFIKKRLDSLENILHINPKEKIALFFFLQKLLYRCNAIKKIINFFEHINDFTTFDDFEKKTLNSLGWFFKEINHDLYLSYASSLTLEKFQTIYALKGSFNTQDFIERQKRYLKHLNFLQTTYFMEIQLTDKEKYEDIEFFQNKYLKKLEVISKNGQIEHLEIENFIDMIRKERKTAPVYNIQAQFDSILIDEGTPEAIFLKCLTDKCMDLIDDILPDFLNASKKGM